jgi:hypothetical protein
MLAVVFAQHQLGQPWQGPGPNAAGPPPGLAAVFTSFLVAHGTAGPSTRVSAEDGGGALSSLSMSLTLSPPYRPCPHPSATPGLPFSTANVFSVDTVALGSATSEMTRMRVVICFASTSTLT